MRARSVLIVDDEQRIGMILSRLLEGEGYSPVYVRSGEAALRHLDTEQPALILLDLKMPGMDGFAVLEELKRREFGGKVLVMTAFGTIKSAVNAIKSGAYDYITKPFDNDDLLQAVARAVDHTTIEQELKNLKSSMGLEEALEAIITNDPVMMQLFETVRRSAPTSMPVLITGESGTGKELFARAVHALSDRAERPFIPLNCGALPSELIESELFGHKKGAFSGASSDKRGLVEEADGGTLFLDEISEMGADTQVKLLRFLEDSCFFPVGGTKPGEVDVRVVAATNRDLKWMIEQGEFREDLFYRLHVILLEIPPLRERADDIPLLAAHFLSRHGKALGRSVPRFSPAAMELLYAHQWPGNVRELENLVRRLLVLVEREEISESDVGKVLSSTAGKASVSAAGDLGSIVAESQEQVERVQIINALKQHDGNRTHAARALGIGRNTLLRKLKKYSIS